MKTLKFNRKVRCVVLQIKDIYAIIVFVKQICFAHVVEGKNFFTA